MPRARAKSFPERCSCRPPNAAISLRVLRMSPRAILLIDGLFEQRPAVWHKEIALALERGVPVLGAASMGALRAAEMAPFGMLGVGRVFEQFRDGALVDDDEVAVVQRPNGEALSDAMVNVRATLAQAVGMNLVSRSSADRFLAKAKAVFYAERNLSELLSASADPELAPLERWVFEHGLVDAKRQDAVAALVLARRFDETGWPSPPRLSTPRTTFFKCALRLASCSPLNCPAPGLPPSERILLAARYLGHPYTQIKELALLRAALWDLAAWRDKTSIDDLEAELLESTRPDDAAAYARWILEVELGRYELYVRAHFRERDPVAPSVPLLARAWRLVDLAIQKAEMDADATALKSWAIAYRRRYGLLTPESMNAFLAECGLDTRGWVEMVRLSVLCRRASRDLHLTSFRTRETDERSHWLEQALRATGLYDAAEWILRDPSRAVLPRTALEAIDRDFVFGEDRAACELAQLTGEGLGHPNPLPREKTRSGT